MCEINFKIRQSRPKATPEQIEAAKSFCKNQLLKNWGETRNVEIYFVKHKRYALVATFYDLEMGEPEDYSDRIGSIEYLDPNTPSEISF